MTDNVVRICDYQLEREAKRIKAELQRLETEIVNAAFPSVYGFADPDRFHAPEKDPA